MNWYGKELYCTRGETFSLDCLVVNKDDTPYRISSALENAFLVLTVTSNKFSQKNRYVANFWINLSDFPKVDDMTILNVDSLPVGDDLITNRVLHLSTDNKYYIYDEVKLKYIEYVFRFIHTFDTNITKEWLDKTYTYDLKLISGVLKESYIEYVKNNYPGEYTESPFETILHEFEVISKNNIYVEENQGGIY